MPSIVRIVRSNWYLLGMACALALGLLWPGAGERLDAGKALSTATVLAIFVLSGLSLPSEEIVTGARNLRAHLLLQAFIFLVVPAYFLLTAGAFRDDMQGRLIVGLYALAVMPTTISSCIVFTQMAGGNVVTAIFNAVLSNLLGVLLSPLLLTLLLSRAGQMLPLDEVLRIFGDLLLKVLAPFLAGQLLRVRVRPLADRHRRQFATLSSCLVLVIVYLAFCKAAGSEALRSGAGELPLPFAYLAASNIVLMVLAYAAARAFRLAPADVKAALFVAPQKTLAMSVPLITTYFASRPEVLGIAMLPVLFYHPWQLLTAGIARNLLGMRGWRSDTR